MKREEEIQAALTRLLGLGCWYVASGGSIGTSFTLHLGAKMPRKQPLTNPAVSEEFRRYEGEHILLVWCSWRLDGLDDALASSDSSCIDASEKLQAYLKGRKMLAATTFNKTFDVLLEFEGDLQLRVFCDRFGGADWTGENWQLETSGQIVAVGPGYRSSIEPGR